MSTHHWPGRCGGGWLPRRCGFTLIEILVTVAVLGVLIAIALPVLGRARETARGTACLSNLRQIGIGLVGYMDAHKGLVPMGLGGPGGDGRDFVLTGLAPHGGWQPVEVGTTQEVLTCPADRAKPSRAEQTGSSYAYELSSLIFMAMAQGPEGAVRVVTRFIEQRPKEFVFRDDAAFHRAGGGGNGLNGVRLDGSTGPFVPGGG